MEEINLQFWVIVTGAGGGIGEIVVEKLLNNNYKVICIDKKKPIINLKQIDMNANSNADTFFKQSIISTIIMLAEKTRGKESVSNLIQYRYDEMMKHSYSELEAIRDGHLKAYNNSIRLTDES